MYPFIETIRIENGLATNLELHQKRLNKTFKSLFKDCTNIFSIKNALKNIPQQQGIIKVRLLYNQNGILNIEYSPYILRSIQSLKIVVDNEICYKYKSMDRSCFEKLLLFKGNCDEILIVKKGYITDTSYTNVAFYDGNLWITPKRPLLKGTMREYLLNTGQIIENEILLSDIELYSKVTLFNAMIPIHSITLNTTNIDKNLL